MATLLNAVTEDTTGTGVTFAGPATLFFYGLAQGSRVFIEVSHDGAVFVPANFDGSSGPVVVDHDCAKNIQLNGSCDVRARAVGVVAASPITVVSVEA